MENTLRNSIAIAIAVLLIAGAVLFSAPRSSSAHPSSVFTQTSAASSTNQNAVSTTSPSFMSQGAATTTYQIDSPVFIAGAAQKVSNMTSIDIGSLYILFNASTTGSCLAWQNQYSNNNIDWYAESQTLPAVGNNVASSTSFTATAQGVIQESTSTIHVWAPGASGVSLKIVTLPIIPAIHQRIVFSIPSGCNNGAVYVETDLKQNPATP